MRSTKERCAAAAAATVAGAATVAIAAAAGAGVDGLWSCVRQPALLLLFCCLCVSC